VCTYSLVRNLSEGKVGEIKKKTKLNLYEKIPIFA
jgi:hypothetical protein